ncbi:hypothetical protein TBLA_0A01600 [Henningerozyma blattae CBS 6284]|uniref:isoleucine--tRNA ligase n=1 Tax=Henningerozyma blattae (strain ATCC 34711 / CBS 6284 / DSM 70876 / NBRC 10599 / NRRL Y-10934 / UCD 77-7) TaxID=1071380 RepID=I2GV07_HENB6|nr:hypothetical protein TBLA_0A01600 [Tetrapisispora blattae CBS 6284]CCH57959.1 hypothetical protein TBLA_0A01600 [Tetrapisispora blattae CBS 6284]
MYRSVRYVSTLHKYQKTLLLPKTKFPVRSNLQKTVNQLIPKSCEDLYKVQLADFYKKFEKLEDNKSREAFVKENLWILLDGPPYANGDLHFGHALNKILKDIINRFQLTQGKWVYYKPGWDCHGLPIELKALKQIPKDKLDFISPLKVRSLARGLAKTAIKNQMNQFNNFAIMTNWNDNYLTMNHDYEVNQLKIFKKMFQNNLIIRSCKPVYWGTETKTALAESELEYNEKHHSVASFVKFPLIDASVNKLSEALNINLDLNSKVQLLIWTSTPWTILANRAICCNEGFTYSLLKNKSFPTEYIILKHDSDLLISDRKLAENYSKIADFEGLKLLNLNYTNPTYGTSLEENKTIYPILHGDHVTNTMGTGLVHTAPGHGEDDYLLGLKNNLEIFSPIDHEGRYILDKFPSNLREILEDKEASKNSEVTAGPKKGLMVLDPATTKTILKLLENANMLFSSHDYIHSYPYDWRSKKPVIIRSTPQWFTTLVDVKPTALESMDKVEFFPKRGHTRLRSFIKNRNEWCISRQRYWGVPIPAFHSKSNPDEVLMNEETIDHVIKMINEKGTDSWFQNSSDDDMKLWLPDKYKHLADKFYRSKETMDVWYDSGTAWTEIINFYQNKLKIKNIPNRLADVVLEGSDQHRGWFQSLLLTSTAISKGEFLPFKQVITHGFTLDEAGRKMSKSIGNIIPPKSFIEGDTEKNLPALGVDGLRYLVAQSDFSTDIITSQQIMMRVSESLKKIRLTFKYLLGNLQEYSSEPLRLGELRPIDLYMLAKLDDLLKESKANYESYSFSKILTSIQFHITNELSSFYFDISKDSLYSDSINSSKRKQIQTVLSRVLFTYVTILMPILPVLVQEVLDYSPKSQDLSSNAKRMSELKWPAPYEINKNEVLKFEQNELVILQEYKKSFNELNVNKTTTTKVTIYSHSGTLPFTEDELCDILQVGSIEFQLNITVSNNELSGKKISIKDENNNDIDIIMAVEESEYHVCPRCWKSNSKEEEQLCSRCEKVIQETGIDL